MLYVKLLLSTQHSQKHVRRLYVRGYFRSIVLERRENEVGSHNRAEQPKINISWLLDILPDKMKNDSERSLVPLCRLVTTLFRTQERT